MKLAMIMAKMLNMLETTLLDPFSLLVMAGTELKEEVVWKGIEVLSLEETTNVVRSLSDLTDLVVTGAGAGLVGSTGSFVSTVVPGTIVVSVTG